MKEMARQETMTAFRAISDLDCLDCLFFLVVHFNHHTLELDQIAHINMLTIHLTAFTGTATLPACDPTDLAIPYPIVDC
jgi:hypothetical protein